MTFPAAWTVIPVTGTYINRFGIPCVGWVSFSSPQIVLGNGTVLTPQTITFQLDSTGSFSGSLPATDDPLFSPANWAYTVLEKVPDGRQPFDIQVPHTSSGINMSTVVPVAPPPTLYPYVSLQELASTASGKGAALVGYASAASSAVGRTVQSKLRDYVSVFDWFSAAQIADVQAGALTQDVTAAVQNALNEPGAKAIFFPAGSYKLTAPITFTAATYIFGAGVKATFLEFTLAASSTANLISINASHTSTWYGLGISNLSIIDNTPTTNTTAIYVESVVGGWFENMDVSGSHVGYSFSNGTNSIYNHIIGDMGGTKSTAIGVQATGTSCGVTIVDTLVEGPTLPSSQIGVGYLFEGGAVPTMRNANTYGCSTGCHVTATGVSSQWGKIVDCEFDTGSGSGLLFDAGVSGTIYGYSVINVWAATMTAHGVHITPGSGTIDGIEFTGGRVFNNTGAGILIEGGKNLTFGDMLISGNGNGSNAGIVVNAAVTGLKISGCRIGQLALYGNTQSYGISLGAYAISGVIASNDLTLNITDGVYNNSTTPLSIVISGNKGYSLNGLLTPTLLNSWVANGLPTGNPYYYIDGDGIVHVQGLIKSGIIGSAAFTLPAGMRPAGDQYFASVSNSALGVTRVEASTGNVTPLTGSNVYFSLCGILFKAEQ